MRLTQGALWLSLGALGCDAASSLTVAEPLSGASFDRCLARVHADGPGLSDIHNATVGGGTAQGPHVDFRINGGARREVDGATKDAGSIINYVFAVPLKPGRNLLELAECDALDTCAAWTAREVTVTLGPGSPDPAFAGTGQLALEGAAPYALTAGDVALLPDGRLLVPASVTPTGSSTAAIGLYALKPDGSADTRWGDKGLARNIGGYLVPLADGRVMSMDPSGKLTRLSATGALDPSFGAGGTVTVPGPVPGTLAVSAFTSDGASGYYLAGTSARSGTDATAVPAVLHIDGAGVTSASRILDDGGAAGVIDVGLAGGRAAFLLADRILVGGVTGFEQPFGTGGVAKLPEAVASGRVTLVASAGGVVAAAVPGLHGNAIGATRIRLLVGTSTLLPVELPIGIGERPSVAIPIYAVAAASDGSIYVSGTLPHPADHATSWSMTPDDGTDFGVVRVRSGAIDSGFGTSGVAHVSFQLSRRPISTETLADLPAVLLLGPGDAPWIVGSTENTNAASAQLFTRRLYALALARLLP